MGQVSHGSARATEAVRRAIQGSQESLRALAARHGTNQKTVRKWKGRTSVSDRRTGPEEPRSTVLSPEQEAMVVAFRRHALVPLDDCLYALQATIPHLTRSSLHRCLERRGISRLPEVEGDKPARGKLSGYPIGFFHIDIAEVSTAEGKLHLFVAVDRTSKFAFAQLLDRADMAAASGFLEALIEARRTGSTPAHRQRHPVRRVCPRTGAGRRPCSAATRSTASAGRTASSAAHQTQPPVDQRPGRAHEPRHQGRHRQPLPLRQP